jgi:hypothetical protein
MPQSPASSISVISTKFKPCSGHDSFFLFLICAPSPSSNQQVFWENYHLGDFSLGKARQMQTGTVNVPCLVVCAHKTQNPKRKTRG